MPLWWWTLAVSWSVLCVNAHALLALEWPYAVAITTNSVDVEECSRASGFAFRNGSVLTAQQAAAMCGNPGCGTVVTRLLDLSDASTSNQSVSRSIAAGFGQLAVPMLDYCWYYRLPGAPCAADPLADLVAHFRDKEEICAAAINVSALGSSDMEKIHAALRIGTLPTCPFECEELYFRIYNLAARMPCKLPGLTSRRQLATAAVTIGWACAGVRHEHDRLNYMYNVSWPVPPLPVATPPLLPTTSGPVEPIASEQGESSSGDDAMTELNDEATEMTITFPPPEPPAKTPAPPTTQPSSASPSLPPAPPSSTASPSLVTPPSSTPIPSIHRNRTAPTPTPTTAAATATATGPGLAITPPPSSGSTVDSPQVDDSSRAFAGAAATATAVLLVAVCIAVFHRQSRRRAALAKLGDRDENSYSELTGSCQDSSFSNRDTNELALSKLVPVSCIHDIRLIGSGGHGVVYLVHDTQSDRLLASKRLIQAQATTEKIAKFIDEIRLVSTLDHPSVVAFVGATWTQLSDVQALFEYMEGGDLRTYLETTTPTKPSVWDPTKRAIAMNLAHALMYLHSLRPTPIVHRDVKSRNVLLTSTKSNLLVQAKLSDFGVARQLSSNGSMTLGVGTSRWLAPEVIMGGGEYTTACDIYSFGVVLSELDTHRLPFSDLPVQPGEMGLSEIAILTMVGIDGRQPSFSPSCPRQIVQLAQSCLSVDPTMRPNAEEVLRTLLDFSIEVEITVSAAMT